MAGKPAYGAEHRRDFRTLRARGMTLAAIARHLGVGLRTVERWEAQRRQATT